MYLLKIKKISSMLILLGLSSFAFADGGVGMKSQKGGFNVGIDALYFRSSVNNLNYAIFDNFVFFEGDNFSQEIDSGAIKTIQPTYDWGFRVQAGYWFPCTCYDINLTYTRLSVINDSSVQLPNINDDSSEIFVPPAGFDGIGASSKIEVTLNMVDLDMGRHMSGNNYDIRLFAGLRYANINRDTDTQVEPFLDTDFQDVYLNQQLQSHFKGVGPRIGAQGRYGQYCGWGLDADVSMAVLIGQIDSHYKDARETIINNDEGPITETEQNILHEPKNGIAVPVFEAKLGADYTYRFGWKRDATLMFEAGYQTTSYFDAINTPNFSSATFLNSRTNNVTFNGPYLGVKYYA